MALNTLVMSQLRSVLYWTDRGLLTALLLLSLGFVLVLFVATAGYLVTRLREWVLTVEANAGRVASESRFRRTLRGTGTLSPGPL